LACKFQGLWRVIRAPVGDTRIQNYAERWADRLVVPTLALAWPVDVRRARKAQIRPIDLGGSSASPLEPKLQAAPPHELDTPPGFEEEQSAKPSKMAT
jgi:hypothetical protein